MTLCCVQPIPLHFVNEYALFLCFCLIATMTSQLLSGNIMLWKEFVKGKKRVGVDVYTGEPGNINVKGVAGRVVIISYYGNHIHHESFHFHIFIKPGFHKLGLINLCGYFR